MIVDGVNFNEDAIKGMPLKVFIKQNVDALWKDRDPETRKAMLEDVYKRINPPEENKTEGQ